VFVMVCLAVTLALLLSRKRSGDTRRRDAHPVVEVGYAVLLAAVAGAIAFITASTHNALSASVVPQGATPEPSARIDVDSFPWCWRFHSTMQFFVRAVPADQYQQWLAQGVHT
jgi:cytochrome c oxidase subunit II